jgi:hypothetical protein
VADIRAHRLPDWSVFRIVTLALCLVFLPAITASGQPVAGCCGLRVEIRGIDRRPVSGAKVEIAGPGRSISDRTGSNGNVLFTLPRPGTYRVSASKDGYLGLSQGVEVSIGEPVTVEFTLSPHFIDAQSVTVTAGADPIAATADSARGADVRAAPERPATLREALPLIPGVVRTPEGKLAISDAAEHRNSLLVDSLDATDPATGSFGATVPVDSVVAFNVYKSPFLAEFGRFTSAVVVVETRGGGDAWRWELNDPTPEFRILGGHLRGIRGWTPRLNFNGPVIPGCLYLSESVEYAFKKTPVKTLAFPFNEDKRESWNSLTRLDWVASPSQLLTVKVHAVPQRLMYYGLGFYNPQPVTPNLWGHEGMADLSHKITIAGGVLETAISVAQVSVRVAGQGDAEFVMTPTGNLGNYFIGQDRRAQKLELLENWSLRPVGRNRQHHLKTGLSVVRARTRGSFHARPISIVGTQQELLERIQFENREGYRATDSETGLYAHDHWVLSPAISLDGGLRFERQSVTAVSRLAPRAAISWSPFSRSSTILRAGAGWFYDRVPLNVFGFNVYPERTIVGYGSEGDLLTGPTTYANSLGTVRSDRGPLVFGPTRPGNFAPRSFVWEVQLEQALSDTAQVRATFRQGRARDLMVLNPVAGDRLQSLILNSAGQSEFRQFELVSQVTMRRDRRLFLSYVYGRTQSNLNEFSEFLGNYPAPLVRPDVYTTATTNIPHRFLVWGVIPITQPLKESKVKRPSAASLQVGRGWLVAPVAEYRTGFPYTRVDERENYAGVPNTWRFPNFFSLDLRVAKNFTAGKEHAVQVSFSVFNLTNHWNPESVRWNTADPQLGEFLGQRPRRFRIDFDLLF